MVTSLSVFRQGAAAPHHRGMPPSPKPTLPPPVLAVDPMLPLPERRSRREQGAAPGAPTTTGQLRRGARVAAPPADQDLSTLRHAAQAEVVSPRSKSPPAGPPGTGGDEWHNHVYDRVQRLETERSLLQRQLAQTRAEERRVEGECLELRVWNKELEGRLANLPEVTHLSGAVQRVSFEAAAQENEDLRKQLSAYAVEIDVLRREKLTLTSARADAQTCVETLEGSNQELQRRCIELDDAVERRDALASQLAESQVAVETLRRSNEEMERRCAQLNGLLDIEVDMRRQAEDSNRDVRSELDVVSGSLQHARGRDAETRVATLHHEERENARKDQLLFDLQDLVESLHASISSLMERYVTQTREFDQFVVAVQHSHSGCLEELDEARHVVQRVEHCVIASHEAASEAGVGWRASSAEAVSQAYAQAKEEFAEHNRQHEQKHHETQDILIDLHSRLGLAQERAESCEEQLRVFESTKRPRKVAKDPVAAKLDRLRENMVVQEMKVIHEGALILKVHDKNHKRDARFVRVLGSTMQLKWNKSQPSEGGMLKQLSSSSWSTLDLYDVIRIDYGCMSRACVIHDDVLPWLCFSLYTARRSYDFICPDEDLIRCFVVGISRLCAWAAGAVRTRRQFLCLKGWCKVEESCFRRNVTRGAALAQAIVAAQKKGTKVKCVLSGIAKAGNGAIRPRGSRSSRS